MNKRPDLRGVSILVLERDPSSLRTIEGELSVVGAAVHAVSDTDGMMSFLNANPVDVIIASLVDVDEQCIEMVKEYKTRYPATLFYVLVDREFDSVESTQEWVRLVVDDYLKKPLDVVRIAGMIETGIGRPDEAGRSLAVIDPLIAKVKPYFLLRSPLMKRTLMHLPQIAASNQAVLITGETGTGKELVARVIHVLSNRSTGPFVPVNCGAVPESLIEGELFGHEKGAFTGAIKTRRGKFETAHNGTLFLDEIGDMPLSLQVRLLRVLEEESIYRIGGESPVPVDARVIAASNVDLYNAVKDGLFRDDLYYRLNVLRINLPPLRERVEDIPLLAVHFLERAFAEMGWQRPYPDLSSETIYLLEKHRWTGNVRELRNVMTRVATLLPENTKRIFPFHILPHLDESDRTTVSAEIEKSGRDGIFVSIGTELREVEELLIAETLKHTDGNRTKAAALLGISLRNLRRKLNK
jgi:DNA-binding NtrC family response regulator